MKANQIATRVDSLQQAGLYDFSRNDILQQTGLSSEAVKKTFQRLVKKHRIAKVTRSFYVIVPLEYANAGSPPASWYIDDLMKYQRRPYYVGLLSAAALHGASHHQPQEFQVITTAPLRTLRVARQRIRFFTRQALEKLPTTEMKTPTGMIRVSTPETTALDLVYFSKASGYLSNVATLLQDLSDNLRPDRLIEAAQLYGETPTVQRLGFLLDLIHAKSLADPLSEWLRSRHTRRVPLRQDRPLANAGRNSRWNLLTNDHVEVES